jgi:hypothetical protein
MPVRTRGSRTVGVGVAACTVAAAIVAALRLPFAVVDVDRDTAHLSSLSYEDREFAAGNSVIPNQRLLYEARARIPSSGTYRVVTGAGRIEFAATFATYFLMPRRRRENARWVLCLGCDARTVAPGTRTVWSDGAGSSLLETPR